MRIVYLVHQYPPEKEAGTELYTARLASGMAAAGHQVRVLAMSHDRSVTRFGHRDERLSSVIVRRLFFDPGLAPNPFLWEAWNPTLAPYVAAALAQWRPDVVHVTHAAYLSASALHAAADHGAPVVFTLTDFWILCPTIQLLRFDGSLCDGPEPSVCQRCMSVDKYAAYFGKMPAERPVAPQGAARLRLEDLAEPTPLAAWSVVEARPRLMREAFDRVTLALSPSRFLKELLVRRGYPASSIEVLPHGIDRLDLPCRPSSDGAFHFGYVGSLAPKKGVHVALAAMKLLAAGREARLHVHGGEETDVDYARALRTLAVGDDRIVLHGAFPRSRAAEVFAGLDAILMPSLWYENAPLVLREALAARIPVVASDLGGMAETLEDGGGILVPPNDPAALAGAMARLRDDPDLRATLRARTPVPPTFEEERHAILAIYERLVRARSPVAV